MLTAAGDVNKPPGETALRHNMSSTGMISTEKRTPRLALEGTGLCLPPGDNEFAIKKGPTKRLPRRSCSHSGVVTTRRISGGTVNLGKLAESLTFNNNRASGKIKSSNESVGADSLNKGNERRSRRSKMPYNKLKEFEVDMSASSTSFTSATTRSSTASSQSRYQRSSSLDLRPSSAIRAMDESASSVSTKSGYQRSSSMDLRPNSMDASSATWGPTSANASTSTGLDASAATWNSAPSRVPRSFRRNLTGGGACKTPTKSSVKICGPAVTTGLKRSNPTISNFSDAVRRTKSSNLDEMRASIRLGDPYSLKGKLEKELKPKKSSSPLDDLASIVSASENSDKPKENAVVEETKEEKSVFLEERGKEQNSNTPPEPKLKRSFSGPLEASSSHTNDDFFRQFDASVAFNDDGFAFAPGLKRHESAPLAEFDSFPDAFAMGEPEAADWNPAPTLSREVSDEKDVQDDKEDEQVAKALMALANARKPRQVRRVSSTTKKDMEAVSQKARASIQEERNNAASAASTSLSAAAGRARSLTPEKHEMETIASTKGKRLSPAERAKARAKERKQIRSTSPMAKTELLTAARRARARVQVRKAAEESKTRLRSRSPMRKMRSASANRRPPSNSLVDHDDSKEKDDKDHTRRRGSAASWHELVCADIDEDVGSVMTSQSCNVLSVSTASPRNCRSNSPHRLRRVNSNPRAVASCILDEDMSIDDDTQKSQVDRQEIGEENPGERASKCEHQLGSFLSAEAKGKEADGCINASEHTVGTQAFSKGMQKIRNLMSSSPLRGRQSSAVGSTIGDRADPRARRTSLQIFKEFVQPKKPTEVSPRVINADAFASEPSSQQQQDDYPTQKDMGDSALGESSAPLKAEVKAKADRHSTEGQQRRKRVSKSRSHAGPRSSGDREKMDLNSRRRASTSGTVREKSSRRKSADRVKAHNSLSAINTTNADVTKGGSRKHDKPRTDSRRRRRSKTDGKQRKSGSEKRKSAESRRLKSHIMHENHLDKSESEMSIGLSELDMSESGHESKSTYTNGSSATGSMSCSSKGRNKSSSSSRSFGLDDSKSRELNSRTQGGVKKEADEEGTITKKSLPERKSLCQSLQLDTVPETYNEDEQSEAPRSPSKRKGRSPSASSSIQSTAELSNSEEERANDVDPNENRRCRPSGGFVAHGSYHPGGPGVTSSLAADELERRWREFVQVEMSNSSDSSMYYPDPRHAWAGRLAMMQIRYPGGHYPVDGRPPPHDRALPVGGHWPLGPNPSLYPPVGPGWRGPRGLGHGTEHDALRNGQRNASPSFGVAKETTGGKSTEKEGSTRGSLRRRHSIGSGHGRDAIMHEVTTAMERELRNPACFRCHEPIGQCRCAEPVVDISRHARESVPMHEEVPGKLPRRSSLRDTFGIGRSETSSDASAAPSTNTERESRDGTMDVDLHVGNPYYFFGPPRPLYDRPATWDVNDYVPASNPGGRSAASRNPNVHRGRPFGGVPDSDNRSNRGHRGMRSFAVDDDSIRYPRRSCVEGSTSGRSMFSSDEGSGRSFF